MSRAYRIKVQESLRRVLRASDHVRTELEMLEILPARADGRAARGRVAAARL